MFRGVVDWGVEERWQGENGKTGGKGKLWLRCKINEQM